MPDVLPGSAPPARPVPPSSGSSRVERSPEPRLRLAVIFGLGTAVLATALWWLVGGLFALTYGLLVVSLVIGWAVGTGVAWGAWGELAHPAQKRLRAFAVGLGLAAWLVGSFCVYVFELAFLPASHLTLLERMANLPFVDFTAQQLGPLQPLELIVIAIFAWRAAR